MTVSSGASYDGVFTARRRASLLITTAMVAASCTVAHAGTVTVAAPVAPATSTPAGTVNANIAADIATPSTDLTLDIKAGAVVTGGNIILAPSAGSGDGAIVVTNAGSVGTVNPTTNAITDPSGITLNGSAANGTKNTATVTNSGLVTNGLIASDFGGAVKIDNSGTIHNGLSGSGFGDVSLSTTSVGAVRSGSINADSFGSSKFDAATGTTTTTSGNVSIAQDGAAASVDGTTKVNISASSVAGKADVTVNAVAGNVTANAGGFVKSQFLATPAAAGKAIDTLINSNTIGGGAATVTIGSAGEVGFVSATGAGGSTVTVDGKVNGNTETFSNFSEFSQVISETRDALDATTETSSKFATKQVAGAANLTVGAQGTVTGNASVFANANAASATVNGKIGDGKANGNLSVVSQGTNFVQTNKQTFDGPTGNQLTSEGADGNSAAGGIATVTIGTGASVAGSVSAAGDAGTVVTNSGSIGGNTTNNGVSVQARRGLATNNSNKTATPLDIFAGTVTTTSQTNENSNTFTDIGGPVTITNDSSGLIGAKNTGFADAVNVNTVGDVAIVNKGTVRGRTFASSAGSEFKNSFANKLDGTVDTATGNTTASVEQQTGSANSAIGGSVTGTYAGANGSLNFGSVDGSINQAADKASTVTVTGSVFGDIQSTAGTGSNSANNNVQVDKNTFDGKAFTSTLEGSLVADDSSNTTAGGVSTVTLTGAQVANGNLSFTTPGNVSSSGGSASTVTATDSTVSGAINSAANASKSNDALKFNYTGAGTNGNVRSGTLLTLIGESSENSVVTGGASVVAVAGKSMVNDFFFGSGINSEGSVSSAVTIGADAKVNGNVNSTVNGFDSSESGTYSYARDAKTTVVTATVTNKSSFGAAAAAGDTSIAVAGAVNGGLNASTVRGASTVDVTGTVSGSVSSSASGSVNQSSLTSDYNGKAAATSLATLPTSVFSGNNVILPAVVSKAVTQDKTTTVGGVSKVTVDTSAALKAAGKVGVNGNISSAGVSGASVAVTSGSIVGSGFSGGFVSASSNYTDTITDTTDVTTDGKTTRSRTSVSSTVGNDAVVTNAGEITGGVNAQGFKAATVTNTGKIGDTFANGVQANALGSIVTTELTDNDLFDLTPSSHTTVTKTTIVPVGGVATVTNAAGATIRGDVNVAGATGTVTNGGAINGTVVLGQAVSIGEVTVTRVATKTTTVATPPAALFNQTYTVDQNGTSRGIIVDGATVTGFDGLPVKTSNITATVNLNNGSATLGSINAQQDETGAFLTDTTVNLNGAGFLGTENVYSATTAPAPTDLALSPLLIGSNDAKAAGFGTGFSEAVRVLGVKSINKTGAGTFVINGAGYEPATPGNPASWTLDVGTFAIKSGEVQLDVNGDSFALNPSNEDFGIKGNVVNDATLVVGRRRTPLVATTGNSLTNAGPESIRGINVVQTGNFTQSATGTTVVGVTPSLVRNGTLSVGDSGGANEVLGPVTAGVSIPFFTKASTTGGASTPSRWDITGDLALGGKVQTNISRDSIFTGQENTVLFSYTGAGTVTATVDTNLVSKFVKLGLKHDDKAKTVSLGATRTSYGTGATNPNAVNAAVGLDSTVPLIATAIITDAAGGAGFSSVGEIGRAQDIANIVSGLDWRLNATQAAQVFDELSSAEFYGSLSSVRQNIGFTSAADRLTNARPSDSPSGANLWLNPVGNFATYGGTESGASKVKVNSYGGAFGLDVSYGNGGAFGFGFGYVQHDASARGSAEQGQVRTFTVGTYWTQRFRENFYANAQFSYGFSKFRTERELTILARTINGEFKGREWDGSIQVGYDLATSGSLVVTPFGELALRHWSMDGFTETGGAGIGLAVDEASKTVFNPTLGVKLGASIDRGAFVLKPYGKLSYTFQGNVGNERTVSYLGGGNSFTLAGVDPEGFGKIEAGIEALMSEKIGVFFGAGYGFGGQQNVGRVQGGITISL